MNTPAEQVGRGAPFGNTNYRRGKMYQRALFRALEEKGKALNADVLLKVCERAIEDALKGDRAAREHIADRVDGKADQAITGPGGGPLQVQFILTPAMLMEFSDDELAAFGRCLPALQRIGMAVAAGAGAAEAGEPEET